MSQEKKNALIEDYICLTFPYQMRDAMESQQETVDRIRELAGDVESETVARQEKILRMMMTDGFRDNALLILRKELESLDEEELALACLYERTMRKMQEVSLHVATAFDKLLAEHADSEEGA